MPKLTSELWKGAWSSLVTYTIGDFVSISGSTYVCIANNANQTPPNGTYWVLVAQAGIDGTVTLTTPQTLSGPKTLTSPILNGSLSGTGLDTDGTLAANSDTKVASQKAVKTFVNTSVASIPTASTDGWTTATDTLVWVSANSFKIVAQNRTNIYTKGTRVKFTNNSITVYGVVISSVFSTDTTVTLAANTDFSINNSAITNPFYSYQGNPQGYPGWFNFTHNATWSGTPPTTPTTIAQFSVIGTQCFYRFMQTNTGAGASNGQITINQPVPSNISSSTYHDSGTSNFSTADNTNPLNNSAQCYLFSNTLIYGEIAAISAKAVHLQGFYSF